MSGINVLSDSLKGGGRSEKASSSKRNDATNGIENLTAEFAAMLSGLMNVNADPIGQNSKVGGEVGESSDSLVGKLGYGHAALSFLFQPIVLSNLPAGKEANSGNGVNQGTGEGLSAGDNGDLVAMNKLSLDLNEVFSTSGVTSQISQGNNPGITELDKYRQVISDLLVALSGEITDLSPEASLMMERSTSHRQEISKLVQGWLTVADDIVRNSQASGVQVIGLQSDNGQESSEFFNTRGVEDLRQAITKTIQDWMRSTDETVFSGQSTYSSSEGASLALERGTSENLRQVFAKTVQSWIEGTDEGAEGEPNSSLQKVINSRLDSLTLDQGTGGRELNTKTSSIPVLLNQLLSQAQGTNVHPGVIKEMLPEKGNEILSAFNQPKSFSQVLETVRTFEPVDKNIVVNTDSKLNLAVQTGTSEEIIKGLGEASEFPESRASHNQTPNSGIGLEIGSGGKIAFGNVMYGKTVAIPVWEQVSSVLREQISNRHQELKELEIKLHPAELGRINISLRWENGQVHLQVFASEAATGQILQNQLSELRHTLTNQGVNCGMLQMGQQGGDQQQNRQGNDTRRSLDSTTNHAEDEEVISSINSFFHGQDGNRRINVTA